MPPPGRAKVAQTPGRARDNSLYPGASLVKAFDLGGHLHFTKLFLVFLLVGGKQMRS